MVNSFKKIALVYNKDLNQSLEFANLFSSKTENSTLFEINDLKKENLKDFELMVTIGGDGSFLKCSRISSKLNIPTLGFNVGRLGYLAQANPNEIDEVFKQLENKDYKIENRLMLKALNHTALNDIVVKGSNCTRSITFNLYINDKIICSYVADGLIIATPTGSTAYSLSAGGPIISPRLDCFLIIPICAHTLNARPIVIPTDEKIKVKTLEENEMLNVSFDGQVDLTVKDEIEIFKNEDFARLIILNKQKYKFYDILKEKLHWAIPPEKK